MSANLFLLFYAIAKVLLWTGVGPGIAIAIVAEKYRIVEIGIEKVSAVRGRQLARRENRQECCLSLQAKAPATSLPRKVLPRELRRYA